MAPRIHPSPISRRTVLQPSALAFGWLAVRHLLAPESCCAAKETHRAGCHHFEPQAKSVIMLVQNGGPSQMDLFDPKPDLTRRAGQSLSVETFQQGNSD